MNSAKNIEITAFWVCLREKETNRDEPDCSLGRKKSFFRGEYPVHTWCITNIILNTEKFGNNKKFHMRNCQKNGKKLPELVPKHPNNRFTAR